MKEAEMEVSITKHKKNVRLTNEWQFIKSEFTRLDIVTLGWGMFAPHNKNSYQITSQHQSV